MRILLAALLLSSVVISTVYAENYSYSPFRTGQSPEGILPSNEQIREDMEVLSKMSSKLRVYSDSNLEPILKYAHIYDLKLSVETDDVSKVISLDAKYPGTIESIIINSKDLTINQEQLISKIREAKQLTDIPITTLSNPKVWLDNPELAMSVDFIFTDVFTDEITPADSANKIQKINELLTQRYPYKHIVYETGWSTIESSKTEQLQFIGEINKLGLDLFYFEYTDEDWKQNKKDAGYGILTADRKEKTDVIIAAPNIIEQYVESIQKDTTTQAATGIGLAGLIGLIIKFVAPILTKSPWGDPTY
ncbi:MAG: hypothetical protein OEL56_02445 [Nitrosopumilus sp.]|nr:hypothetical protein [Nitrosopumilus sp.]MDH3489288.1 hypothetical protein [Nitrosopumilus sp.]MDH3516286.1 hypothetical protein [Nitrosopumilus sp.]MDH3564051.1 hypothetical protein [Nitrosopumilus sp.]MDH5417213.1 hypothetical protein [Nitrosopumilus sp.]